MEKIFEILLSVTLSVLIVVHGETLEPTSMVPSTEAVPVEDISTVAPTTMAPTTMAPTTMAPTTMAPTTMAPTTMAPTTMAPTTVTPTPTPAPSNLTIWTVINSEGKACVLMTANITLNITYATTEKKNASKLFLVPQSANASGNCGNESQTLILTFDDDWMLTYIFKKIDKDQFGLDKTTLVFKSDSTLFPGITPEAGNKTVTSDINIPKVKAVNAYKCNAEQTVFFNTSVTPITGDLELQQFQVAAYKSEKIPPSHKVFGDAQQCPADSETSNIVPIVVGAALAALVVIVLIAYLVSRNRAQGGYESV